MMNYKLVAGDMSMLIDLLEDASKEGWHPVGNHTATFIKDEHNNFVQYSVLMTKIDPSVIEGLANSINNLIWEAENGAYKN